MKQLTNEVNVDPVVFQPRNVNDPRYAARHRPAGVRVISASAVRLLVTNDIFGSFFSQQTSYGFIRGGDALVETVDRLREDVIAAAWIDGGDFSGGGPLAPIDADAGWAAAGALGIDAAVLGNHEFDFGDDALRGRLVEPPFPLIAADLDATGGWSGVGDHIVVAAPEGRSVAVIGLCLPERRGERVYFAEADLDAAAARLRELAASLRPDVDHVVAVVHDGVAWLTEDHRPDAVVPVDPRMGALCAAVSGHVDAVVGGHTLWRHIGAIANTPYVQPWAFATEVGVLDFTDDGLAVHAVDVDGPLGWSGPGTALEADLRTQVIGRVPEPLVTRLRGPYTLGQAVAEGLLIRTGADVALITQGEVGCVQPAVDGFAAHLPAGPVTEADICRVVPWVGGQDELWAAVLAPDEIGIARGTLNDVIGPSAVAYRQAHHAHGVTLVSAAQLPNVRAALDGDVDWAPTGVGLRDGLHSYVTALG
jgi:hypothetical protein